MTSGSYLSGSIEIQEARKVVDGDLAELDAPDSTNATTRVLGDADQGIVEFDVNSVALSKLTSLSGCMGGHWGGQLCLGVTTRLWLLRDPSYSQRNANIYTPLDAMFLTSKNTQVGFAPRVH